jgi:hypothetical protein
VGSHTGPARSAISDLPARHRPVLALKLPPTARPLFLLAFCRAALGAVPHGIFTPQRAGANRSHSASCQLGMSGTSPECDRHSLSKMGKTPIRDPSPGPTTRAHDLLALHLLPA